MSYAAKIILLSSLVLVYLRVAVQGQDYDDYGDYGDYCSGCEKITSNTATSGLYNWLTQE